MGKNKRNKKRKDTLKSFVAASPAEEDKENLRGDVSPAAAATSSSLPVIPPPPSSHQQQPQQQKQKEEVTPSPSRYAAIASLDQELEDEDERWTDRTSIITRLDHEMNEKYARDIVDQVVCAVRTPEKKESSSSSSNENEVFLPSSSTLKNVPSISSSKLQRPPKSLADFRTVQPYASYDSDGSEDDFRSAEQSFSSTCSSLPGGSAAALHTATAAAAAASLDDLIALDGQDLLASVEVVEDSLGSIMDAMAKLELKTTTTSEKEEEERREATPKFDEESFSREKTPVNFEDAGNEGLETASGSLDAIEDMEIGEISTLNAAGRDSPPAVWGDVADGKYGTLYPDNYSNSKTLNNSECTSPATDSAHLTVLEEGNGQMLAKPLENTELSCLSGKVKASEEDAPSKACVGGKVKASEEDAPSKGELPDLIRVNQVQSIDPNAKDGTPEFEEEEKRLMEEEQNLDYRTGLLLETSSPSVPKIFSKAEPSPLISCLKYSSSDLSLLSSSSINGEMTVLGAPFHSPFLLHETSRGADSAVNSTQQETPKKRLLLSPSIPLHQAQDALVRKELLCQQQLLEKDKEIHAKEKEIQALEKDANALMFENNQTVDSNRQMMLVVEEYERTISEIISERERERVVHEIEKEKLANTRNQVVEDLGAAERSFDDVNRKYERMKEVISGFKENEDSLKATVHELSCRCRKAEESYERLRSHAEHKLAEANQRVESLQKSRQQEIARMEAMLRKAEMKVSSLERTIEQKDRENQELTVICDELIAKVGN